jgi:hypothetical protein
LAAVSFLALRNSSFSGFAVGVGAAALANRAEPRARVCQRVTRQPAPHRTPHTTHLLKRAMAIFSIGELGECGVCGVRCG